MAETRPCPFCKGKRHQVRTVWQTYKFVACLNCKAGGPVRKTEEEAIDAWNDRDDQLKMDLELS